MDSPDKGGREHPKPDEAQEEFNARRREDAGHEPDRPVPQDESDAATPPHGDPLAG